MSRNASVAIHIWTTRLPYAKGGKAHDTAEDPFSHSEQHLSLLLIVSSHYQDCNVGRKEIRQHGQINHRAFAR
jgi:hypothetical protein